LRGPRRDFGVREQIALSGLVEARNRWPSWEKRSARFIKVRPHSKRVAVWLMLHAIPCQANDGLGPKSMTDR